MAEENTILYTFEIKGLDENLRKLAEMEKQINENKAAIKDTANTSEQEAQARKIQLQQQQQAYKQLQNETKAQQAAEKANIQTLGQMRAELAKMNKELENLEVGSEAFQQLSKDSLKLRNKIKDADEATGRFQANVGNYKGAIMDAFRAMGVPVDTLTKSIGLMTPALKTATVATGGVSTAMKILRIALISTGIGAIVVVLGSLIAYLATTEKGVDAVTSVLKPLQFILKRLVGVVQQFGEGMAMILSGNFEEGFKKMGDSVKGLGTELKNAANDGKKVFEIGEKIEEVQLKLAQNEGRITREMAEQERIRTNENLSAKERKAAAEKYIALNDELMRYKKEIADLTYKQAELEASQSDKGMEKQIELAKLKEESNALEAERWSNERKVQNDLYAMQKKAAEERLKSAKEWQDKIKEIESDEISFEKEQEEFFNNFTENHKSTWESTVQTIEEVTAQILKNVQENNDAITLDEVESNTERFEARKAYLESIKSEEQKVYDEIAYMLAQGVINEKEAAEERKKINRMVIDDKLNAASASLELLKDITGEESAVGKAAAIAIATINTYKGASKAIADYGMPLGGILAALTIATGLQNVAKIVNVKLAKGVIGLQGAGSETSDSIPAMLSKGESVITAKASKVYAPVLAEMERSVGNRPNVQIGNGRFANGLISGNIATPRTAYMTDYERALSVAVNQIQQIPVVVSETDITSTQNKVRKIKVTGDL